MYRHCMIAAIEAMAISCVDGYRAGRSVRLAVQAGSIYYSSAKFSGTRGLELNKSTHVIRVIDSHTGGEPTRTVIDGLPLTANSSVAEQLADFRENHDHLRRAIITEPRGSDVLVGAALCKPSDPRNSAAVVFFNNVAYLGMCGHGSIGLAVTLAHLGRIEAGDHTVETPAGNVVLTLHDSATVSVRNVASYRYRRELEVDVPEIGVITGDVAWGGNWFFLIDGHSQNLDISRTEDLTRFTWAIRRQLELQGIRGPRGELIDHVELFGPPSDPAKADSKNFVLCPGAAYDRSPCGTGTSAKLACLIEDGKIGCDQVWRQESITGSVFEASARKTADNEIIPTITGSAFITGETRLFLDDADPFRYGINVDNSV